MIHLNLPLTSLGLVVYVVMVCISNTVLEHISLYELTEIFNVHFKSSQRTQKFLRSIQVLNLTGDLVLPLLSD